MDSGGLDLEGDDPSQQNQDDKDSMPSVAKGPITISHGLISKAKYLHKSKNCDIQSVTYNSKTGDYIIVDSRGFTAWAKSFANDKTTRLMDFAAYQFNVIKILLYCRKFNSYFALSKDYQLKIYNLNFHETFSVASDTNSVIHMLFNSETDELITASRGELQFWQLGETNNQFKSDLLKPKYGLILVRKWGVANGKLISRLRLDEELQRLYCLCEKDIWCYDMFGKLLFKITEASPVHLSACAYAIPIHSFIVGSIDGQVNVLTTTGGKIHTFYSHIGLITEILIHPSDNFLVITSSLDGYIKIFSLDVFEELYSIKVFESGIEYMALRSNTLLYCVSVREIEVFDLNYFYQFWGQLRYPAQRIELVKNAHKSLRVLVLAEDGSLRLFSNTDGRKLCTVLPPPSVDVTSKILDCVHDRDYNLVYLLIKVTEIWVYTTKTDPACHLAFIDLQRVTAEDSKNPPQNKNQMIPTEDIPQCNCIEVLQDLIDTEVVENEEVLQTKCNFLACGMESGQMILFNPLRGGQREKEIQMCKDPIVKMKYDRATLTLLLVTRGKDGLSFKVFNRELECVSSISCNDDLTVFSLRSMTIAAGFSTGHVAVLNISPNMRKSFELVKTAADHQSSIKSISFHPSLDILCSLAEDSCVKIWSTDKTLLCDINFDTGLKVACFLNSSGDILIGLQSQIFIVKHDGKLAWLADKKAGENIDKQIESEIYESPYLKYDIKRPLSADSENMEKYLVPYQDMMFSSIASWVFADKELETDEKGVDMIDKESSDSLSTCARSDIYQSSVYSDFADCSDDFWMLPECVLSPEESSSSSDNDIEITDNRLGDSDNETIVSIQKPVLDPKSRLDLILKESGRSLDSAKSPNFTHNASTKLKSTRIHGKVLGKKQNVSMAKQTFVKKNDSGGHVSEKASPVKSIKRIKKKTSVAVDERRRAVHKRRFGTDKDSEVHVADYNDEGYESKVSLIPEEQPEILEEKPEAIEEKLEPVAEHLEHVDSGVLISSGPIILTKHSSKGEFASQNNGNDEVSGLTEDQKASDKEDEDGGYPFITSSQSITASKQSSRAQTASTCKSEESYTTRNRSDDGEMKNSTEQRDPTLISPPSIIDYDSSSDDDTDDDDDGSTDLLDTTYIDNTSSIKSSATKTAKYIAPKKQQEEIRVKVIPASSQQLSLAVTANAKPQSHRAEQNAQMAVYAMSNRATTRTPTRSSPEMRSPSPRASSRQWHTPVKSLDDSDAGKLSRQSSSRMIRVPFGNIDPGESLISTSKIDQEVNRISKKAVRKTGERRKSDLMNFCFSAFKQKNKSLGGRDSPRRSANSANHKSNDIIDVQVIEKVAVHNSTENLQKSSQNSAEYKSPTELENRELSTRKSSQNSAEYKSPIELENGELSMNDDEILMLTDQDLNTFELNSQDLSKISGDRIKNNELFSTDDNSISPFYSKSASARKNLVNNNVNEANLRSNSPAYERDLNRSNQHDTSLLLDTEQHSDNRTKDGLDTSNRGFSGARNKGNTTCYNTDRREVSIDIYRRARLNMATTGHKNKEDDGIDAENPAKYNQDYSLVHKSSENRTQGSDMDGAGIRVSANYDEKIVAEGRVDRMDPDRRITLNRLKNTTRMTNHNSSRQYVKNEGRYIEDGASKFDEKSVRNLQREGSKGKLIFVNVPSEDDGKEKSKSPKMVNFREEVFSPVSMSSYDLEKESANQRPKSGQQSISCVPSLQDKLLKRRALSARMTERQTSAKFRRDIIEQQKLSRSQHKMVSPSFGMEYVTEYLPEPEPVADKVEVCEYMKPVPLPCNTRKPSMGIDKKSLEARLSGQPFRYGKSIASDENEEIIVDFIKSSMHKQKKDVVLLPRPKSSPSIPAKCHEFVLVKESNKHPMSLSKFERDLLSKRFNDFSI